MSEEPVILLVTEECMQRLRKEGSEEVELPDGRKILLKYLGDGPLTQALKKLQPQKGCYVWNGEIPS
jgi:hypothetical protein